MNRPLKVVYDCNVFLQALGNPNGPAGRCVELALSRAVSLYFSPQVLEEIRDVTSRPKLVRRFQIRPERVQVLMENLPTCGVLVPFVQTIWSYERDPDDAHYVNLAITSEARLVVSRDRDLLDLMEDANADGQRLRHAYPDFRVLTPPAFLAVVEPRASE